MNRKCKNEYLQQHLEIIFIWFKWSLTFGWKPFSNINL